MLSRPILPGNSCRGPACNSVNCPAAGVAGVRFSEISAETVSIAHITRERGVRGELNALPLSDVFDLLPPESKVLLVLPSGSSEERTLRSIRRHNKGYIISFHGINTMTEAALYRNALIVAEKEILPSLPAGLYFTADIIGLSVITTAGEVLGKVEDVFATGSNDVYVVRDRQREILIPAIKEVVKKIDPEEGIIVIDPMKGMLDEI
ncbi:MAG: ribosome maturation factor RimM [Thermodesulfovibrionales bacterium]